jgi:hypothetical protein
MYSNWYSEGRSFWAYEDDEWILLDQEAENTYNIDPNLKMPYLNQYTVGVEREISRDISISATFIYRTNHDFIDRINLTSDFEPVQWTDPSSGQTYTVYSALNPLDPKSFYITNPKVIKEGRFILPSSYPDLLKYQRR